MSTVVPFTFENSELRVVMIDGEPWWAGIDVAGKVGLRDTHQALERLEDYERGRYIIPTPSGETVVNFMQTEREAT